MHHTPSILRMILRPPLRQPSRHRLVGAALPLLPLPLLLLLASSLAQAQASSQADIPDPGPVRLGPPGTEGGVVGLGLASGPRYLGAGERQLRVLPILGYQWANGWFASTAQGVGVNLSASPDLQYGPRLTIDPGRRARDEGVLKGMGAVHAAAEAGGFINYRALGGLWLNASLRAGAGQDHRGARMDLGASYGRELAPGLRLRLGTGVTLANQAWAQTRFGVSDAQSTSSGNPAFRPAGGLQDVNGTAGLSYAWSPRVTLSTGITATRVLGDAKDSPLVGKRSTVSGLVGLTYGF